MDKKTAGLWARADDVVRWRRDLHKLKDMATALLADLGDMTCYRLVPEHVPDDLENQAGEFEGSPSFPPYNLGDVSDAIIKRELAKAKANAAKIEAELQPDVQAAAQANIYAQHQGSAEQRAEASRKFAEKQAENSGRYYVYVPPELTEAEKEARFPTKPKKTRVSFKALHKKISEDHSLEVANYAVSQMSGADRNATHLKAAMENFLGTFPSQADAAHAFAEAEGELGLSSEEAVVLLQKAHHKLTDAEGRVAVWANRKKGTLPNEQPPSKDDPAHKWAERVEEVNAAKKAEPQPKPKRKRKPPSQKVELPPPHAPGSTELVPDANDVVEARAKKAERKAAAVREPIEDLPPLPPPDDVEQDWDDFLDEGAQK